MTEPRHALGSRLLALGVGLVVTLLLAVVAWPMELPVLVVAVVVTSTMVGLSARYAMAQAG